MRDWIVRTKPLSQLTDAELMAVEIEIADPSTEYDEDVPGARQAFIDRLAIERTMRAKG